MIGAVHPTQAAAVAAVAAVAAAAAAVVVVGAAAVVEGAAHYEAADIIDFEWRGRCNTYTIKF